MPLRIRTSDSGLIHTIAPRTGVAFRLAKGQTLSVIDPEGEQVCDLVAYYGDNVDEVISSGRSIDYASSLFLTTGDILYSNRSRPMLVIGEDRVGRHDFTLTPCSKDTFRIIYDDEQPHHGCQGNLERVLKPYGIGPDRIPVAFNVFMHVAVDGETGQIKVLPPLSKAGDMTRFHAQMDLIIGLTACAAGQSNNFSCTPIQYRID